MIGTSSTHYAVQHLRDSKHSVFILMLYALVELLFWRNVVFFLFFFRLEERTKACHQDLLHTCFSDVVLLCLIFRLTDSISFITQRFE